MGHEASHDGQPSAWVCRHTEALPPGASVLDVACGKGRHARWLAARGCRVAAVDRDAQALSALAETDGIDVCCADIEAGPWPYRGQQFAAVVVTRYLHRPLFPALVAALAPGGLLVYETYMRGHEQFGRPHRAEFLLEPGELLSRAHQAGLEVIAFETHQTADPPSLLQRICARRPVVAVSP